MEKGKSVRVTVGRGSEKITQLNTFPHKPEIRFESQRG